MPTRSTALPMNDSLSSSATRTPSTIRSGTEARANQSVVPAASPEVETAEHVAVVLQADEAGREDGRLDAGALVERAPDRVEGEERDQQQRRRGHEHALPGLPRPGVDAAPGCCSGIR